MHKILTLSDMYNIVLKSLYAYVFFKLLVIGTPGLEFTWLPDDLYCANKTVHKKGGESAEENAIHDAFPNIPSHKFAAACSSYEGLSLGSFAFRVRQGSDVIEVQTFDADSRLQFVCMTNKTAV